jgi:hypothetical protein
MVEITNVNAGANQITISAPGLMSNYNAGLSPIIMYWSTSGVYNHDGVENMTVNAANSEQYGLSFVFCNYCWIKNIAYTQPSNAPSYFAFYSFFGYQDEFRDSYIGGSTAGGGPTQYGMWIDRGQSLKIENNIFYNVTSPLLITSSTGLVAGYNFTYRTTSGAVFPQLDTHRAHVFQSLFEGNVSSRLEYDSVWGSASHNTGVRNYFTGNEPGATNYRVPFEADAFNRYMNLVGNALGDTTYQTVYECTLAHNTGGSDTMIYDLGWNDGCELNNSSGYDTTVESSLVRWGNFDTVSYNASGAAHHGTHYCTGTGSGTAGPDAYNTNCLASETASGDPTFPGLASPSTTIPASFYTGVTAKSSCGTGLSFWKNPSSGTCPPYPPIGPDVTCSTNCSSNVANHAAMIPAQLCYQNTAKDGSGFLTAFDASACYAADSTSGSSSPAPPTGLSAKVN